MENKAYLIFRLHGLSYGLPADRVKEIFLLPELTSIVDAPTDIIGLLDVHDRITPVMHLDLRFGHRFMGCHLNDSVIVLESQGLEIGIIVHQVETVTNLDRQYIQTDLDYGRERKIHKAFIGGVVNLDDEKILLLDVDKLLRHQKLVSSLTDSDGDLVAKTSNSFYELYCPQATSEERVIFRQRAENLRRSTVNIEQTALVSVAVFGLGGEYFGLDLNIVREFIKIGKITSIPCCPHHIVGNMNLRGEILTLIDLRQQLKIPDNNTKHPQAVVVDVNDIVAGIVVDEVFDAIYLSPDDIKSLPIALENNSPYLKGTASYLEQTLHLIDFPRMLDRGNLAVDMAA
jgi:purine-binding chemotaxis protein CheW